MCKLCEAGKYSNNSIKCLNIPPDNHPSKCIIKNATKRGCNSFAPCSRGLVTTQAGQSKCERCSPGMTTFIEGSIKCSSCPKGTAGTNGTCTPCTGLTHAPNISSTTCKYCSDINMVPDNSHIDCVKQEGIGHGPIIYNIYAESRKAKLSFQFKFNFEPPVKTWRRDYVRVAATNSITKEVVATNTFLATDLHGNFTGLPITNVQFIFKAIIIYTNNKQSKPYIYPFSSWTTTSICNSDSLYLNATSHKLAN